MNRNLSAVILLAVVLLSCRSLVGPSVRRGDAAIKPVPLCDGSYKEALYRVSFTPDGKAIAASTDHGIIKFWDLSTWHVLATYAGTFRPFCISTDGKTLALGGQGLILYDLKAGKKIFSTNGSHGGGYYLAFTPDSKILSACSPGGTVWLFDAITRTEIRELKGTGAIAFSRDGRLLAAAQKNNTISLYGTNNWTELSRMEGHTDFIWDLAFSPDSHTLASSGNDAVVILWDVASGKPVAKLHHEYWVAFLAFSPDGKLLATQSGNHFISIWHLSSRKEIFRIETQPREIRSVCFSPDGKILASAMDEGIAMWDVKTGKPIVFQKRQ